MLSEIEKLLQNKNQNPLTAIEKSTLWSRIRIGINERERLSASQKPTPKIPIFNYFGFFKYRLALVTLLIVALLGGSFATITAADEAKPGDLLFPIDIATERIHLLFTTENGKDILRIRFAEERLTEVKIILALESSNSDDSSDNQNATSTDQTSNNGGNATSTDQASDDDQNTTSTDESSSDNDDSNESSNETSTINTSRSELAFLIALEQLEEVRAKFEEKGNTIGLAVINEMIAELTALVENHLDNLKRIKIKVVENGNGDTRIEFEAYTDNLKTKFKLTQKNNFNGEGNEKILVQNSESKTQMKIKADGIKIEFQQKSYDSNDNNKYSSKYEYEYDKNKKDYEKVKVCYNYNNKKVYKKDLDHYLDKGAIEGQCSEKKVEICHKDHEIYISKNALQAHLNHGDYEGKCEDGDHDEDGDEGDDDDNATTTPDIIAPIIYNLSSNPATSTATVSWNTDEDADSKVYYGTTTPLSISGSTPREDSSNLVTSHSLSLLGLTPNTIYYYIVTSSDGSGNSATTTEATFTTDEEIIEEPADTEPPVISDLNATDITEDSVSVSWLTDENSTSKVYYDTTTPLTVSSSTPFLSSETLSTSHLFGLSNLASSTTYYFIAVSTDDSGNTSTSSEDSFTTLTPPPPVDTTPPAISNIGTSDIASTTATVSWSTNEESTSKIYYGETTPLDPSTALYEDDATLTLSHSLSLSGLTASSTAYYIITSTDSSGNTATSSENLFTTLGE